MKKAENTFNAFNIFKIFEILRNSRNFVSILTRFEILDYFLVFQFFSGGGFP